MDCSQVLSSTDGLSANDGSSLQNVQYKYLSESDNLVFSCGALQQRSGNLCLRRELPTRDVLNLELHNSSELPVSPAPYLTQKLPLFELFLRLKMITMEGHRRQYSCGEISVSNHGRAVIQDQVPSGIDTSGLVSDWLTREVSGFCCRLSPRVAPFDIGYQIKLIILGLSLLDPPCGL